MVEVVFLMLILKLPVLYLGAVVYWAVKAHPRHLEGALPTAREDVDPHPDWSRRPRRRPRGPHGSRSRVPARASRREATRSERR